MAADAPDPAQPGHIRYLTAADVEAMAPPPQLLREAIIRIFRAKDQDLTVHEPKMTMLIAPGHFFQSLVGASLDENRAMTKWASIVAENPVNARFWEQFAQSLYQTKDYKQAIPAYQKALELLG